MKKQYLVLGFLFSTLLSSNLWAYGTGFTSSPLISSKRLVSTEFTGITSSGGGVGVQARYTQKLNSDLVFDAGIGMSGGDLNNRVFIGADYLVFPDYKKQPRVSIKTTFENAKEFDDRRNIVTFSPNISKGFSFWGREAFPYLAIPIGLNLNTGEKTYDTSIAAQLGIVGQVPIEEYKHITVALEGTVKIQDHFSGVFVSFGYPLD